MELSSTYTYEMVKKDGKKNRSALTLKYLRSTPSYYVALVPVRLVYYTVRTILTGITVTGASVFFAVIVAKWTALLSTIYCTGNREKLLTALLAFNFGIISAVHFV